MPFEFSRLDIPDVLLIRPRIFKDARGSFLETYKHSDFVQAGIPDHFVQDNSSRSRKGTLRGLHYQKDPAAQGKLVRCTLGRIYDVAVDIRKDSPSYARWVASELSSEGGEMLYVPPGFAHGFLVMSDEAEVLYKCTAEYSPADDRGIRWNDPDLSIDWPMKAALLSEKDRDLPFLTDADNNFRYQS